MPPITTALASPAFEQRRLHGRRPRPARPTRIRPIAHVEGARRSISGTEPDSPSQRNKAGVRHDRRSIRARVPAGSTRGRLSVMPPPVMCAMPLTSPRPSNGFNTGR